jgi:type 1 fimbriae regulatory protein FimB
MRSLTRQELDALLEVARRHDTRDWLMFSVTFCHGLRVSETLSLTRDNIQAGYLSVERLKGSKDVLHPLLDERQALENLALATDDRLFPMSRFQFYRKLQRYGREAGIPAAKCHPHALKHTCGRLAYESGVGIAEIQNWLGHVNGANTMIYMAATEEQAAAAFSKAFAADQ